MRIAILGAGGVGGYYGGALARVGHEVLMLARGSHLDALRERGLEVRTPEGTFAVAVEATGDPEEIGAADYAVLAVKNYSLPEIVPATRLLAERGAVIVPLLNGVDVAERLIEHGVPEERVLGGLTEISAARIAPGVVERRSSFQRVAVGEREGRTSERAERIVVAFREAGAEARVSEDITADLWRKFIFIAAMSAACGLTRSPVGAIRNKPLGQLLIERAVHEVAAVARGRGVAIRGEDTARILAFIASLPDGIKPSFLLDVEAGGPTEIDDLSGAVSRLGRLAGVETPVHDVATVVLGGA